MNIEMLEGALTVGGISIATLIIAKLKFYIKEDGAWTFGKFGSCISGILGKVDFGKWDFGIVRFLKSGKMGFGKKRILGKWDFGKVGFWHEK